MNLTTMGQATSIVLLHFLFQTSRTSAFQLSHRSIRRNVMKSNVLTTTSSRSMATSPTLLNMADSDNNDGAAASPQQGLVAMGSALQSQLASAFSQLDESDQYDAILTGLCAKILDDSSLKGDEVISALQDPLNLLEEMNTRRVVAGSRSIMALVDVSGGGDSLVVVTSS
jgi:hypothetical protein